MAETYVEVAARILGPIDALLGSKSAYFHEHPDNETVFNANVCTVKPGKIWYGDLDLTLKADALQSLADMLNDKVYVLREMDGRFENTEKPLLDRAVRVFEPDTA